MSKKRIESTTDVELEYIRYVVEMSALGNVALSYNKWRLALLALKMQQIEELTKRIKE